MYRIHFVVFCCISFRSHSYEGLERWGEGILLPMMVRTAARFTLNYSHKNDFWCQIFFFFSFLFCKKKHFFLAIFFSFTEKKGVSTNPTAPFKIYDVGYVRSSVSILMHIGSKLPPPKKKHKKQNCLRQEKAFKKWILRQEKEITISRKRKSGPRKHLRVYFSQMNPKRVEPLEWKFSKVANLIFGTWVDVFGCRGSTNVGSCVMTGIFTLSLSASSAALKRRRRGAWPAKSGGLSACGWCWSSIPWNEVRVLRASLDYTCYGYTFSCLWLPCEYFPIFSRFWRNSHLFSFFLKDF